MKRCILFLLGLILLPAFSIESLAADVKFSGEFYAVGMYLDETTFRKDATGYPSTAFYFQRLRARTEFIVTPALKLITRFDAMERIWGGARSAPSIMADSLSAGTRAENENIAFDWAYVHYASKLGLWRVGYMDDGAWGTVFADSSQPAGVIAWSYATGPWYFIVKTVKLKDNSYSATSPATTASDVDTDKYAAAFKYSWKGGSAGVLGGIGRDASKRPAPDNYLTFTYSLTPYAIAQIGPVKLQAEVSYAWGKLRDYDNGTSDIKLTNLAAFVDAVADFGMFYAGGTFAYISGDNSATANKSEGGRISGGMDWNPCLLLWNYDRNYWAGTLYGHGGSVGPPDTRPQNASSMSNAWFGQLRGGIRPVSDLDIMASVSYAQADKKPWATPGDPTSVYLKKDYGVEVDVVATYRITSNLSYMLGGAYLFTGGYFKGADAAAKITDNYLLINKLTLTF